MNKEKEVNSEIDIHTPIVSKHVTEESPTSIIPTKEIEKESVEQPEIIQKNIKETEVEIEIPKIKRNRRKVELEVDSEEDTEPKNKKKKLIVSDNFVKLDLNRRKIRTLKSRNQKPKTRKAKILPIAEPTFTIYDPISLYIDYKLNNIPDSLKSKIPLCYHSEPAIVKKVVSKNRNYGRSYYRCRFSKDMKCDFFIWKDDVIYNLFKPLEDIESENKNRKSSCSKMEEEEGDIDTETESEEENEKVIDCSDENLNEILHSIYEGKIKEYKPKQKEIIKSILNHHNTVYINIYLLYCI